MINPTPTRKARSSIKEHPTARLARLASQAIDAYLVARKARKPEARDLGFRAIAACLDYIHAPRTPKAGRLFWAIQARSIAIKLEADKKKARKV